MSNFRQFDDGALSVRPRICRRHGYAITYAGQSRRSDALNVQQFVDGTEPTILVAVVDDSIGTGVPNHWRPSKILDPSRVEVNSVGRSHDCRSGEVPLAMCIGLKYHGAIPSCPVNGLPYDLLLEFVLPGRDIDSICQDLNGATYAIFIQDALGLKPAMQVTDRQYNAQHAKWFPPAATPNRPLLIVAAQPTPANPSAIATLDVTAFMSGH
jgi:hypothetical protein